jgi:LDH2 family malate/lactate/ureidoglycolate dehydrogenase
MEMHTFSAGELEQTTRAVLEALGSPPDLAAIVAHSLVEANLMGHDSHGVIRLPAYAKLAHKGQIKPAERSRIAKQHKASAQVDGCWGWGQPAAHQATQTAIGLAREFGVAAVTITRCNHVGRLGEYVELIARAGLIGMAMSNIDAAVAPFGGRKRVLGTNPMAYAVPRADGQNPVLIDFATSGTAEGKLQVARAKGEKVGPGLILDKHGLPSQDPEAFYDDGVLLPFGGHKGYGLSVMIDLLGGALSGMAPASLPDYGGGNGTLLIALNIPAFVSESVFTSQVEGLCANLKSTPTAPGFKEVLVPGDPEWQTRAQRLDKGIELPATTWQRIQALAHELQISTV